MLFGVLLKVPSGGVPYPVFALAGLLPWQMFASALSRSSSSLVGNTGLLKKIYLPRFIVPTAATVVSLVDSSVRQQQAASLAEVDQLPYDAEHRGYYLKAARILGTDADGSLLYDRPPLVLVGEFFAEVFLDAGNAFNRFDDIDLKLGTGIGVRWRSPVGLARLDFGIPLDDADDPFQIYITVGPEF